MTVAQINSEVLHDVLTKEPLLAAKNQFGESGVSRLKDILRFLKRCARHATVYETTSLKVFALTQADSVADASRLTHATAFQFGTTVLGSIDNLIVEIREDGSPFVWQDVPAEISSLIGTGIVYQLLQGVETFSINGVTVPVPKVVEDAISQFCLNYFTDLRQALLAYRDSMARTSKCHLLRQAWAEPNRLWFDNAPEFRLRKALHNYLYSYLRHDDIDLREEQNVDDSHPVDIKILWRMENRSAIIEVKWIGKSINLKTGKVTADYSDSRARDGARQLADYLEKHRQEAAKEDTRGYLVVFDCRRKLLKPGATSIGTANGLHYREREIVYKPKFYRTRQDFDAPIRMFLEPVSL
jgi:hypothetical protein